MTDLTLKEAQEKIDKWVKAIGGGRYFTELSNMAQLTEEVGELARIMNRIYGDQSFKEGENRDNLPEEITDVLFVLICIANQTGVDLSKTFQENLDKKTARDAKRHADNEKLKKN